MSTIPTIANSSARPSSKSAGDTYYQTDIAKIILWSGSAWKEFDTSPRSHPAITLTVIDHDTIRVVITSNGSDYYEVQIASNSTFTSNKQVLNRSNAGSNDFSSLSSATTYYVRVISTGNINGFSYSMTSPAVSTYTAPAVPSISASTLNTTQLSVSWSNVAGESGYQLQESSNNSSWNNLLSHSLQYSYNRNVGASNTLRYYRVRARDSRGIYSGWSTSASARTGVTPAAPSLALADTPGSDSASLDWNDVSGASGYQFQVSTNSSFSSLIKNTTQTASSGTVNGLSAGTTYYARVRAYRDYTQRIYSGWSSTLTFTTIVNQTINLIGRIRDDGNDDQFVRYTATVSEPVLLYKYHSGTWLSTGKYFQVLAGTNTALLRGYPTGYLDGYYPAQLWGHSEDDYHVANLNNALFSRDDVASNGIRVVGQTSGHTSNAVGDAFGGINRAINDDDD